MFVDGIYPFNLAEVPCSHSHCQPMERWAGNAVFVHTHTHRDMHKHTQRDKHSYLGDSDEKQSPLVLPMGNASHSGRPSPGLGVPGKAYVK